MTSPLFPRALFPRATTRSLSTTSSSLSPPNSGDSTTVSTAVSTLIHHRSKSRWSTLFSLFPKGFTPFETSQILIKIRNNPRLSQTFFQFAIDHSLSSQTPNLHCYATIIHILARARLNSRALTLIKTALRIPGVENLDGYEKLDHGYEKSLKLFKELVETYKVCDSTPLVFDLLIRALLDGNKIDPCLEIVRLLSSGGGFCLNVKTCNVLIWKVCQLKGCFVGYDLYREMFRVSVVGCDDIDDGDENVKKLGVRCNVLPNVHTFNELMLAFHRNGSVDMVEQVWIEMCCMNCSPKVCSYSILMAVYCEVGEMGKAWDVWEELRVKGLKPDVVAYNTLIGGYCRIGEIEKGEELYREMGLGGLEGTCVTYQHLINGYCLAGDADNAMVVWKDMDRKGFSIDSSCVDSMVRVLCDKRSALEALEFFRNVMRNADFVAREKSYEVLVTGLCGEGKMEEALKLQAEMVGKGFRPNSHIYGAFVDGYVKQGKPDVAASLRQEMVATQV